MSCQNHNGSDKEIVIWEFRLYVHGDTPRSKQAFEQVEKLCKKHLPGRYRLECIDLLKTLERAAADQILATPTLVKVNPPPKKMVGDFANEQRMLEILDLEGTVP